MDDQHGDEPKKHFRGSFIPAFAFNLLHKGKITHTELILLGMIDSMVNEETNTGCYASSAYLAKMLRIGDRQVQYSIKHLVEIGVVRFYWATHNGKKKRYLYTAYSKITLFRKPAKKSKSKRS